MACYRSFLLARAQTLPVMVEQALMISGTHCNISVARKNVMSVVVPEYTVVQEGESFSYGLATTQG